MSIRVMTRVWDHSIQKGSDLLVLLALADIANDAGFCWPSVDTVSQRARLTRRATQKILRALEQEGDLAVLRGEGPKGTHLYQITTAVPGQNEPVRTGGEKFSPPPSLGSKGGELQGPGGELQGTGGVNPSSPEPSLEPSTKPLVVTPPVSPPVLDEFAVWYAAYPNKIKRPMAERAWNAARRSGMPGLEQLLFALAQHKRSDQWTKDGGRFVPHPATWLNNEMWMDRLPETGGGGGSGTYDGEDVDAIVERLKGPRL